MIAAALVRCFHCSATYDALAASWCGCLVGDPTLNCRNCGRCFCDQPSSFRRTFWNTAPRPLIERRAAELRADFTPDNHLFSADIIRPLILVADDNRLVLRLAHEHLRRRGFGALAARDGDEALDLFLRYTPDLVLTDALLPKIDGRELCHKIKVRSEVPVVVMSAVYTQPQHRIDAVDKYRANEYLLKPVSEAQLDALLTRYAPRGGT